MRQFFIIIAVVAGLALGYMLISGGPDNQPVPPDSTPISPKVEGTGVGEQVAQEFDRLVEDAKKEHPDMPASIAAQKRAQVIGAEQLADAKSANERSLMAASQFWGFLYVNTRARRDYCEGVGVDIGPFVDAFSAAHEREKQVATQLFEAQEIPHEELWQELQPTLMKAVRQDMTDIQNMNSMSPSDACRIFAERPDDLVKNMLLKDKSPATYNTLMAIANTP